MIKTLIKKDLYKDSVSLMLLNNKINAHEEVNIASIMMASPANKEMFEANGLLTKEVSDAGANDVAIVLDLKNEAAYDAVVEIIEKELEASGNNVQENSKVADSLEEALKIVPNANLAIISIPGIYAYSMGMKCLDKNLNLMIFSDNVSIEEEKALKEKAKENGLLVMGPDCGTSIINSVPLAFANKVKKGRIGIVGASGTGIQETISVLDTHGYGISHAIGTGGRDLHEEIGASTFLKSLEMLMEDPNTDVILALSKPPAKEVQKKVNAFLSNSNKPVASLFLGNIPDKHYENYYQADSLEELALLGIALLDKKEAPKSVDEFKAQDKNGTIKGLYCGGTLAYEAGLLIERALNLEHKKSADGYILQQNGFEIIDLGDDKYTKGKPHPMIDPTARTPYIEKAAKDKDTKVVLLDLVIGYGANEDPASTLKEVIKNNQRDGLEFVVTICGTKDDFQDINKQEAILKEMGVKTFNSNKKAVEYALSLVGYELTYPSKEVVEKVELSYEKLNSPKNNLLEEPLNIINIGLSSFTQALDDVNANYVQYDFRPIAGGNKELMDILVFLENWEEK